MRLSVYAAALLTLTLAVWAPTTRFGFVYEDRNDLARLLEPLPPASLTLSEARVRPFRSLSNLSHQATVSLIGVQPWGFHAVSIVVHLINVLLLFTLAWRLWHPLAALLAAGLFAVHPIQIEAVAYVSSRPDLLAGLGVLLALWAASAGMVALAVVGVGVAALGKESALVAWGLVPLWAWTSRAPLSLKTWAVVSLVGVAVAFGAAQRVMGGADYKIPLGATLAHTQEWSVGVLSLASMMVWPTGPQIDHDWSSSLAWLAVAGVGVTVVWACWAMRRRAWLAFGVIWTVGVLGPRLLLPTVEGLHEHHWYLVFIGWCLCAGALVDRKLRETKESVWQLSRV